MLCTKHNTGFPWFVTGLVEDYGCFSISFEKSKSALSGFRIKPVFTITQHRDNKNILEEIQGNLGKGRIVEHLEICSYELRSVVDIKNILIDHFNKYPLKGIKKVNYKIFEKIIMNLFDKKHLSKYKSSLYNKLIIYLVWSIHY